MSAAFPWSSMIVGKSAAARRARASLFQAIISWARGRCASWRGRLGLEGK